MSTSYMDYASPNTQFAYDLSNNVFFKKDDRNYILSLSIKQLNTLGNSSILDIYLSKRNYVEPHLHQNASELVYCVSGAAVVSLINPFTNELLNFPIAPGQVANVPQGWWHYEVATVDNTHLIAIFDAPIPEAIFGSDILRLTPASVLADNYCLDEAMVKETLAPIKSTVVIGPPADCDKSNMGPSNTGGSTGQGMTSPAGGWTAPGMMPQSGHGMPMMPQQGQQVPQGYMGQSGAGMMPQGGQGMPMMPQQGQQVPQGYTGQPGAGMMPQGGQGMPMMPQQGQQVPQGYMGQPGAGMMPQQTPSSHGTYAYPLRPIETAYSPYPPQFHPVPFLYRNMG
ncbi:MAG: Cupin [Paenibacillus sp.]|nr:Cupin [Paenibacillus sp.]